MGKNNKKWNKTLNHRDSVVSIVLKVEYRDFKKKPHLLSGHVHDDACCKDTAQFRSETGMV